MKEGPPLGSREGRADVDSVHRPAAVLVRWEMARRRRQAAAEEEDEGLPSEDEVQLFHTNRSKRLVEASRKGLDERSRRRAAGTRHSRPPTCCSALVVARSWLR